MVLTVVVTFCVVVCAVFALPVSDVKKLCCRRPALLTLRPELLNSKLEAWAGALQLGKPAVINTIIVSDWAP